MRVGGHQTCTIVNCHTFLQPVTCAYAEIFYCRLRVAFPCTQSSYNKIDLSRVSNYFVFNLEIRLRKSKLSNFAGGTFTVDDAPDATKKNFSQISECLDILLCVLTNLPRRKGGQTFQLVVLCFKSKAQDTSRDTFFHSAIT
jgi:hypothetical protein